MVKLDRLYTVEAGRLDIVILVLYGSTIRQSVELRQSPSCIISGGQAFQASIINVIILDIPANKDELDFFRQI